MQLLDALVEVLGRKEETLDPRQLGLPRGQPLRNSNKA